eukprot:g1462.t1
MNTKSTATRFYVAKVPFYVRPNTESFVKFKEAVNFSRVPVSTELKDLEVGMYLQPRNHNPNARPLLPCKKTSNSQQNADKKLKKKQFIFIPESNAFQATDGSLNFCDSTATFNYNCVETQDDKYLRKTRATNTESRDYCHQCAGDGELLCCDFCELVWHFDCAGLDEEPPETETWACPVCMQGSKYMPTQKRSYIEFGKNKLKRAANNDASGNVKQKAKYTNMDMVPILYSPAQQLEVNPGSTTTYDINTNPLMDDTKLNLSM